MLLKMALFHPLMAEYIHCVYILRILYPLIYQRTLLPCLGYCE